MIFGEVLPENRFWNVTVKILKNSQGVILSCQFLCRFPRLLYNFHQLNTFRCEQRKIFVKIDFCTAVRFWQISAISLFCVSFSLLFLVFALFFSQNTKRPKIFLLFIFIICLFWFLAFILLYLLLLVCYKKIQKDFALFACFPFVLVSNSKTPKIFAVLLWFCKVHFGIQWSSVAGAWFSLHIIQATQVKGNNDDLRQFDCGERLV